MFKSKICVGSSEKKAYIAAELKQNVGWRKNTQYSTDKK